MTLAGRLTDEPPCTAFGQHPAVVSATAEMYLRRDQPRCPTLTASSTAKVG